jgi:hypothetical protein
MPSRSRLKNDESPGREARGQIQGQGVVPPPGLVPQSVLRDTFKVRLPSLARLVRAKTAEPLRKGRVGVAAQWRRLLDEGAVRDRAELARREGLSRARVTRVLGQVGAPPALPATGSQASG